jgi:hypothetical protein
MAVTDFCALADFNRRNVAEITEGLIPVPQRRSLVRRADAATHPRHNLLEFPYDTHRRCLPRGPA